MPLSEINQTRERAKKKKKKPIDTENRLMVARGHEGQDEQEDLKHTNSYL